MGLLQLDLSATAKTPVPDVLAVQAQRLRLAGAGFKAAIEDTAGRWPALDGLYDTPQKHLVLAAMKKPASQAVVLDQGTSSAAAALEDFAESVRLLRQARESLQTDIAGAEAELEDLLGDSSSGQQFQDTLVRYQWNLQDRANALARDYEEARQACVAALALISRASADVPSFYSGAAIDLQSHDAERLHRQATSPGATLEDVQRYYDFLAGMSAGRYAEFAADYPESAVYPPRLGIPAEDQARFWNGLAAEQREALAVHLPAVVGNTEGVPYSLRAAANAAVLALVLKPAWRATPEQRQAYKNIQAALAQPNSKRPEGRGLISFDPGEPPLAAVAIGNMDTAENITINVSGMGSSTTDMEGAVWAANSIYQQQMRFADNHAVVAWIGYDAPDMPPSAEVLFSDKAQTGGNKLATVIDGVYNTRTADVPRVSVTAHSYGTTTAAFALSQTSHTVDTAVFFGSAGIDEQAARTAADLNAREVLATQGDADFVAPGGIFGSRFGDQRVSPSTESWGAEVFSAEAQTLGGQDLKANGGHSLQGMDEGAGIMETELGRGYLDSGTASLWQIAAASTGNSHLLETSAQSATDARIEAAARRAADIYYAPGRAVDGMQSAGSGLVDRLQAVQDTAADSIQAGAGIAADVLQERFLPDIGPYEHPLGPVADRLRRGADAGFDEVQRRVNEGIDLSQTIFDTVVDANQKAADDYFKEQWRMLEFRAGELVRRFGTD